MSPDAERGDGLTLHHHLDLHGLTGNSARRRLLELARARPGLSLRATAREAGIARTTACYHLRVLDNFGLVTLSRDRPSSRVVRVFVPREGGPPAPQDRALVLALTREACRRIATAFAERASEDAAAMASLSLSQAAQIAQVSKPTAWRHLRALIAAGVVETAGATFAKRRYVLATGGLRRLQTSEQP